MHSTKAWDYEKFNISPSPHTKEYLQNVCMEFKVLLVMDNAGSHSLGLNCKGIQVEFLPVNINFLIAYESRCDPYIQGTLHTELSPTHCALI